MPLSGSITPFVSSISVLQKVVLSKKNTPSGECHVPAVIPESCVANTTVPITHVMSDCGVSEPSDTDFLSQHTWMIPILTDHFRCTVCAPTTVDIWCPPPPRCSMCTSDIFTCAPAIEDTDNEENVDGDDIVVPRNRRDLKADAMSLWHLLTRNPSNKFCPICQMAKAQKVRHVRGPAEGKHLTKVFGDCITADYFVFLFGMVKTLVSMI